MFDIIGFAKFCRLLHQPCGCGTASQHLRSFGTRLFGAVLTILETLVHKVHNRKTSGPVPKTMSVPPIGLRGAVTTRDILDLTPTRISPDKLGPKPPSPLEFS